MASDNLLATSMLPKDMKCTELKIILLSLKLKEDGIMPVQKKEILKTYKKWKHRNPPVCCETLELVARKEEKNDAKYMDVNDVAKLKDDDKDVLEAMMSLVSAANV